MTYIASLDPNHPDVLAAEQAVAYWDDIMPDWEDREAGEGARYVDFTDVEDPEAFIVTRYGWDHARLIPGASD